LVLLKLVLDAFSTTGAQDPNYTISINDVNTIQGNTFNAAATLDNSLGMDIAGWSYGVCNDPAAATPIQVNDEDTATVKNGAPADFNETAVFADGWTQGVVICFTGCAVVGGGTSSYVMASADYTAGTPGDYTLEFCDTLGVGAGPVDVVLADAIGHSITPTQVAGNLHVGTDPCAGSAFTYIAPDAGTQNYPASEGAGSVAFSADFSIQDDGVSSGCDPDVTQGFSMGCSNDGTLIAPTAVTPTLPFDPDFAEAGIFSNGWTIGIVYSFTGVNTLTFPAPGAVLTVDYAGVAGALMGVEGPTTTALTWDSGLGTPPVSNVVVVGGASISASFADGSVTLNGTTTLPFVGGDCNGDAITNIADIIWLLSQLFTGGPTSLCPIACDANGDGVLDAADPVHIANYVFLGGPAPAGSQTCDTVPGQTPEDCAAETCTP